MDNHFKTQLRMNNELSLKGLGVGGENHLKESIERKPLCFHLNFICLSQKNFPTTMADDKAEFMKSNFEDSKVSKVVTIYEKKTSLLLNDEVIYKNLIKSWKEKF